EVAGQRRADLIGDDRNEVGRDRHCRRPDRRFRRPKLAIRSVSLLADGRLRLETLCMGAGTREEARIGQFAGSFTRILAPRGRAGRAVIWPPWRSTILAQIANPSPIPRSLEVTKASNTLSIMSASIPGPSSCTSTMISPFWVLVAISIVPLPFAASDRAS